jgi:hypothetical protein
MDDIVRQRGAGDVSTAVRDEHCPDPAFLPEERLRLVERHEHGGVSRAGALEPDDVSHSYRHGAGAGIHQD